MEEKNFTSVFNILASAGDTILKVYRSDNYKTSLKTDRTPVTRADKASSKIINEQLSKVFPEIPILDEETTIPDYSVRKDWKEFFLVDPLDGTKEFIKQNGEFCINLALIEGDSPRMGWIYHPLSKRGWYCKRGEGIFEFDKKGIVRKIEKPGRCPEKLRIITSRSFFKPQEKELIDKIKKEYKIEIIHRGSSIKQIAIILGEADMYLKAGPCSEWDTAPGQLLVEEFGGSVVRLDNLERMKYNKPVMKNPYFVMQNEYLTETRFLDFLKKHL
ncbi:3'(2'),5'-bisphosphate nucleotidase CysQ [Maribellus comscasis]|uniref:3'(2'),5-bisphosphonucleoside 3'(2')-phosphohydrolase n=1 Tax=Maribellus comscasis TaxID=2681766 RepID=A0A6I6JYW5_9BACT|nr:inositol monophosphatase family protein [Maribellus comscasis]QGY44333.1 3'(2'),5'-bisphosphate nucleotidase CysQ [Maribellus comscasis]